RPSIRRASGRSSSSGAVTVRRPTRAVRSCTRRDTGSRSSTPWEPATRSSPATSAGRCEAGAWRTSSRARTRAGPCCAPCPVTGRPLRHRRTWRSSSARAETRSGGERLRRLLPGRVRPPRTSGDVGLEERVELLVTLAHALVHAAGQHAVAGLEAVGDAEHTQPGAPAVERLERQRLQEHLVGHALVGERPHDALVRPHLVEAAEERGDLLAVPVVGEGPLAAGARVPLRDP